MASEAGGRGLSVGLGERQYLGCGDGRWRSRWVHGGLRCLATGDVGIARRSGIERGMMQTKFAGAANADKRTRYMVQIEGEILTAHLWCRDFAVIARLLRQLQSEVSPAWSIH